MVRIMKIMSLFVMFSAASYAVDIDNYNELNLRVIEYETTGSPLKDIHEHSESATFRSYNDFIFNRNFKIATSVELGYIGESFNYGVSERVESNKYIDITQFMLAYRFDSGIFVSGGQIDMKQGAFSEYAQAGRENSDGLFSIYDTTFQGATAGYEYNDKHRVTFGTGRKYFYDITTEFGVFEDIAGDTQVAFLFTSNEWDIGDTTVTLKLNGSKSDVRTDKYPGVVLADLELAGIGLSIDDTADTGWIVYGIAAHSEITDNIYKRVETGYSTLLGLKKEFEYFRTTKTGVVGAEWFHASEFWKSMVSGQPSSEYGLGKLGDTYNIYMGLYLNARTLVMLKYYRTDFSHIRTGPSTTMEVDMTQEKTSLEFIYNF